MQVDGWQLKVNNGNHGADASEIRIAGVWTKKLEGLRARVRLLSGQILRATGIHYLVNIHYTSHLAINEVKY